MAEGNSSSNNHGSYEPDRIEKADFFLEIAFLMEMSPLAQSPPNIPPSTDPLNVSGAVFVLPNERALSVDCSQKGVHGAVRALLKFGQERARGCQVYLSRRPCSSCAKLLVQCGVARVLYLPFEPELDDVADVERVDSIFLQSNSALSRRIPKIEQKVFQDHENTQSLYYSGEDPPQLDNFLTELKNKHWSDGWKGRAGEALRWREFDRLESEITPNIEAFFKWITRTTIRDVPDDITFNPIEDANYKPVKQATEHVSASVADAGNKQTVIQQETVITSRSSGDDGSPNPGDGEWQKLALHMSRLAQMLSQRSDDPARGVGCVLTLHNEIIAIGWNGFPAKALYGEFPRASSTEGTVVAEESKEPYVIHAEQNALLTRTAHNLDPKSTVLYINEIPCRQCIDMLVLSGVKYFVIPKIGAASQVEDAQQQSNLKYAQEKGVICYASKRLT